MPRSIKVGDRVLSRDDSSGKEAYKPVSHLFVEWHDSMWTLSVAVARGRTESILTTVEHPFWVVGKGWLPAGDVHVGDNVLAAGGRELAVSVSQASGAGRKAYNLTVEDFHT